MLYNDNPRTIKDFDENKKRLKKEAERETLAGKQKMQIEEQGRKQLKVSDKKREIDELTRNLVSQELILRRITLELDILKSAEQREKIKLDGLIRKTGEGQLAAKTKIAAEASKLKKVTQDEILIKAELNILAKKLNEAEKLERSLGEEMIVLEKEGKAKQKLGEIIKEKSPLEMIQRRILAVGDNIQKANRETADLKADLQKKNSELRALMG